MRALCRILWIARVMCVYDGVLGRIALRFITLGGEFGDSLCCSAFSRFEVQAKKTRGTGEFYS